MSGRKILVVSAVCSHPGNAGNRVRIQRMLEELTSMGNEIHFVYVRYRYDPDDTLMRARWGDRLYTLPHTPRWSERLFHAAQMVGRFCQIHDFIDFPIDTWYDDGLDDLVRRLQRRTCFDAVLAMYATLSKVLLNFDDSVLKVLDTHDVFTARHRIFQKKDRYRWISLSAQEEAKALDRADVVMAIQSQDAEFFAGITRKPIVTVGHSVALRTPQSRGSKGTCILFIGTNNLPNLIAVRHFITDILPLIRAQLPQAVLHVVGQVCMRLPNYDGCKKVGEVEELEPVYAAADVVISPILVGTGLKIKLVEALGQAKPVVTTSQGSVGLEEASGNAFLVADGAQQFAASVIDVLTNEDLANRLSRGARAFAEEWNRRNAQALQGIFGNPGLKGRLP